MVVRFVYLVIVWDHYSRRASEGGIVGWLNLTTLQCCEWLCRGGERRVENGGVQAAGVAAEHDDLEAAISRAEDEESAKGVRNNLIAEEAGGALDNFAESQPRRPRAPGNAASGAQGDASTNDDSGAESRPSAHSLIADDIKQRITLARFFASGVADADVALDWVFFSNLLDRCCDKRTDGTSVNASLMVAAAVFAAIGTLLWSLAAFDMFGWVRYLWFVGRGKQPRFDGYIPRTHMLVANILLEDAPQLVITFVASASSSLALANIVTSLYALFAKLVETLEASRGEYTLPALVSVAPLVRVQMDERRRARDAATTTVNDFVDAAQAIEKLVQGRLTDQRLSIADWSALPGSDTPIGEQLRDQLVNNKNMRKLLVGGLDAQSAQDFAEVLKDNQALQTLDLPGIFFFGDRRGNSISDEGAKALGEALKANKTLQMLNLTNNSIGAEGAAALGAALKANKALQTLYLDSNSIGDEGAKALGAALKDNQALERLYLRSNSIGDEGAAALGAALKDNQALQTLDLNGNSIGEDAKKRLRQIAKERSTALDLRL